MKRPRSGAGSMPSRVRERHRAAGERHVFGDAGRRPVARSRESAPTRAPAAGAAGRIRDSGRRHIPLPGASAIRAVNTVRRVCLSQGAHYIHGIRELHRERHHRSRGSRARPQAARHVYRRRRLRRPASSRLGDARQLRRRGDERPRVEHPGHAARRRLVDHDRRRRPRHPGRQASDDRRKARSKSSSRCCTPAASSSTAATRRPAACTASAPASSTRCRRSSSPPSSATASQWEMRFKQGKPISAAEEARPGARHRHDRLLPPRRRDLSEDRIRSRDHQGAPRGRQLPAQGAEGHLRRRSARRRRSSSSTTRGSSTT